MNDAIVCSIIMPSYRSVPTIRASLTALLNQDFAHPYEVIVVDSSPDETPDIVRREFPMVRLFHLAQQTDPAAARNIGADYAYGEVLAFIDSDCVAGPDWLRRMVARLNQGYAGVGGATANGNGETAVSWAGYFCEFREFLPGGAMREMPYLSLNAVAYRRATFWAAGGFPAGYFPQEDQVFHKPMREGGARFALDPAIVVAHTHRSEAAAFFAHQRRIGRANALVMRTLDLQGAVLTRYPLVALVAMPLLIPYRFIRTVSACLGVERGLIVRQRAITWLCWQGMCWWGCGFIEQVLTHTPQLDGLKQESTR